MFSVWKILLIHLACFHCLAVGQDWQEGDQNLANYLADRKLNRLATRMLDFEYARTVDATQREKLAVVLNEYYQKLLLTNPMPEGATKTIERAESLMRDFPGKEFPDLGLALCHAKYLIAEQNFFEWWGRGAPAAEQLKILTPFENASSDLQRWASICELQRQNTLASLPFDLGNEARLQLLLQRIESRRILANYLLGWTHYFRFIIPTEPDYRKLSQSHEYFYLALQIEQDKTIEQIDSKWLDFSTVTGKRALLGLGMVYTAQDKIQAAKYCFKTLQQISPEIDISLVRFNSFAYSRNWTQALQMAKSLTPDRQTSLWNAVLISGYVATNNNSDTATRIEGSRLQRVGLLGLLRAFDDRSIRSFVDQTGMKLKNNSVEDLWIEALLIFKEANATDRQEALALAAKKCRDALKIAPVGFAVTDRTRIEFLTALIEFQQNEFSQALELLTIPESQTRADDSDLAERILWLRCRCLFELSRSDKRLIGLAISSVNRLLSDFPQSPFAPQARFEKMVATNRLLDPENAILELEKVTPDDPFFIVAQFEILKNRYQIWNQVSLVPGDPAEFAFQELVNCEFRFRSLATDNQKKLAAIWLTIDARIRHDLNDVEINALINLAESIAMSNGIHLDIQPQLMFYRFLSAKKFEERHSAVQIAKWLLENPVDQKIRITALAFLADHVEHADLEANQKIAIFEQLSDSLGNSESDILNSNNARVAASRLVNMWIVNGKPEKAKPLNELLLKVNPNSQIYNLNAARIATKLDERTQAISLWTRVANGSSAGSGPWLESKYQLIQLLAPTDLPKAEAILTQTIALAGRIEKSWQDKFDELSDSLAEVKHEQ